MKLFGVLNQVQHDKKYGDGVEMLNQVQLDTIRMSLVEMLNQVQYEKRRKGYPPTRLTSCPISFRRVMSCSR